MSLMEKFGFLYKFSKNIDKYQKNIKKFENIKKDIKDFSQKELISKIFQLHNAFLPYTTSLDFISKLSHFDCHYYTKQTDIPQVGFSGQLEYTMYSDCIVLGRIGFTPQVHMYFKKDKTIVIEHKSIRTDLYDKVNLKNYKFSFEDFSLKDLINISATVEYVLDSFSDVELDIQNELLMRASMLESNLDENLLKLKSDAKLIGAEK